jgi:hypothetical protein
MNMNLLTRRQASSSVAFLVYGEAGCGGALEPTRFPARKSSG